MFGGPSQHKYLQHMFCLCHFLKILYKIAKRELGTNRLPCYSVLYYSFRKEPVVLQVFPLNGDETVMAWRGRLSFSFPVLYNIIPPSLPSL